MESVKELLLIVGIRRVFLPSVEEVNEQNGLNEETQESTLLQNLIDRLS